MRNWQSIVFGTVLCVMIFSPISSTATEHTLSSTIRSVTVYQDRARVYRKAEIPDLPEGEYAFTFDNLPLGLDERSIQIKVANEFIHTILGFSAGEEEQPEGVNERVDKLEKQMDTITTYILPEIEDRISVLHNQKKLLTKLGENASQKMNIQLKEGTINVKQWDDAFNFMGDKLQLVNDSLRHYLLLHDMNDSLSNELYYVQQEIVDSSLRTSKSVHVDINKKESGKDSIEIAYTLYGASWKPVYTARLQSDRTVSLSYNAEIFQSTGEDWEDVNLTLSLHQTDQVLSPEPFDPWVLTISGIPLSFIKSIPNRDRTRGVIAGVILDKETGVPVVGASVLVKDTQLRTVTDINGHFIIENVIPGVTELTFTHVNYNTVHIIGISVLPDHVVDASLFAEQKVSELAAEITVSAMTVDELLTQATGVVTSNTGEVFIRGGRASEVAFIVDGIPLSDPLNKYINTFSSMFNDGIAFERSGLDKSFLIERPATVLSNAQAEKVIIAESSLKSDITFLTRPKQQESVFRLATMTNTTHLPLLPGRVQIFSGAHYLGASIMDTPVHTDKEFSLPFGDDNDLTVKWESFDMNRKEKSDKIELQQSTRITLVNMGTDVDSVRVEEPMPVSQDDRIDLDLEDMNPKPVLIDEWGKAVWILPVPAGDSATITYSCKIKFPKGIRIKGL